MTDSAHQDPMVAMRRKGIDKNQSGVWCSECHRERTRLDAQLGGKLCNGCRKHAARKTSAHLERRSGRMVAPGSRSLEDIDDIVAYVERVVGRVFPYTSDPEEYVNEGVAIAYRLHRDKWRRDLQPQFSKYLSTLLPQRLKDFWRQDIRQQGRGERKAEGGFRAREVASLDAMREAKIEIGSTDSGLAA